MSLQRGAARSGSKALNLADDSSTASSSTKRSDGVRGRGHLALKPSRRRPGGPGGTDGTSELFLDSTPFYAESGGQSETAVGRHRDGRFESSTPKRRGRLFAHRGRVYRQVLAGRRAWRPSIPERASPRGRNHTARTCCTPLPVRARRPRPPAGIVRRRTVCASDFAHGAGWPARRSRDTHPREYRRGGQPRASRHPDTKQEAETMGRCVLRRQSTAIGVRSCARARTASSSARHPRRPPRRHRADPDRERGLDRSITVVSRPSVEWAPTGAATRWRARSVPWPRSLEKRRWTTSCRRWNVSSSASARWSEK